MSETLLTRSAAREEVWTDERCFITELVNDPGNPEMSLAECRVPCGTTTQLHELSVKEWYVVSNGQGRMEVGGQPPFDIGPGDTVFIPAGAAQRVTSTGDKDLQFHCVCIPRFTPECYKSLEDG